ncbi:melanotransferrin [Sceloporus undulatus]|uniref:melanotransferrin n=1 Tax=Sceloporus undulatus TaxID=8520 RepID=UPI001C4C3FDB|nr:melanotransferrin [Sceloporus undulatus]
MARVPAGLCLGAALLLWLPSVSPLSLLRWCTLSEPELAKCSHMSKAFSAAGLRPALACVRGDSAFGCLASIKASQADVVTVDGGLVYRAGKEFGLQPLAGEDYGGALGGSYLAVAVVRSGSDLTLDGLRGARSCHTGLNRTAGWNVPIGLLLDSGRMAALGCDLPAAASAFFSASCVPGALGPGFPESLCRLCKGDAAGEGRCQATPREDYFGYTGALRCLAEGAGEVAFIKHSTVQETLQGGSPRPSWAGGLQVSDFQLLCRDGGRAAAEAWQGCHLARVPGHAVVTRPGTDRRLILQLLQEGQEMFGAPSSSSSGVFQMFSSGSYGGQDLLFKDSTVRLVPVPEGQSYQDWLGEEYLHAMRGMDCDPTRLPESLRWCVFSPAEIQKCSEMALAFQKQRLKPMIRCVSAESRHLCMEQIQKRAIDAVTLAGEDIYTAGRDFGLVPAAGESYAEGDTNSTYYAVAVVRRAAQDGDGAFTIHELRGRRSCHTGFGRRAGWTLPVGLLLSKGLIQSRGCSVLEAVSTFFSASCVPTDRPKGFPPNLCRLCAGDEDGNHKCEASDRERYFGYTGAFRCLAEGHGEVAFVKHTSVFENTDGRNAAPWASGLHSADFQLLCPNGARAEVDQFANCHWGRVPPRAIMVHPETNPLAVYGLLDRAQDFFGAENNSNGFKMFNSSDFHGQDLIFRDATTAIVTAGERTTTDAWLGQMFLEAMEGWESFSSSQCSKAAARPGNLCLLLLMLILFARCFSA